jgi:hypothetical protein
MERRASFWFESATTALRLAACVVGIAMLLCFPAVKAHRFGPHFRTPEVRRAMERHTFVAHSDDSVPARVAQLDLLPTFFIPADISSRIVPREYLESISELPLSRMLNRRKLNPSGSGGQVPLLQA